jgi:hypothetical protein
LILNAPLFNKAKCLLAGGLPGNPRWLWLWAGEGVAGMVLRELDLPHRFDT